MSNALDERLQENVWETRIPLKIKISPKDLITSVPLTLYYSLPRISYLSSIFGDIIKNFEGFIQVQLSDFWIECEGVPLKWQYPFGVLVDNLGIDASSGPLTLTVHIKDFPSEKVVQYTSLDSIRFYFINPFFIAICCIQTNVFKPRTVVCKIITCKKKHVISGIS